MTQKTGPDPAVAVLKDHRRPDLTRSLWQLVNTLAPLAALFVLSYRLQQEAWWWSLVLAVPIAGLMVRTFIIFHDCGHGSFFRSRRANEWVGFFTGLLTLTPHHKWWFEHIGHHGTSGDLDRRGLGDVWMMTVREWKEASRWKRTVYWFFRHPAFMFTVGPLLIFVVLNRFPGGRSRPRERRSVLVTNLALGAVWTALLLTVGWKSYLLLHLPVLLISGAAGIWLFYVQHQFEGVYWSRHERLDRHAAALEGSSHYDLPRWLHWFTGNIGFHHIHHLDSRIPNYRLAACHRALPPLPGVTRLSLRDSLRSLRLRLFDEERGRMVGFADLAPSES